MKKEKSMSSYIKFREKFISKLEIEAKKKESNCSNTELLEIAFNNYRYTKILGSVLFGLLFLSLLITLIYFYTPDVLMKFILGIGTFVYLLLYIYSFYYISSLHHFIILRARLNLLEGNSDLINRLNLETIFLFIKERNIPELLVEKSSSLLYKEIKEAYIENTKVKKTKVLNSTAGATDIKSSDNITFTNSEKLSLLFLLLNCELNLASPPKELINVVGALLQIAPYRISKTHLTELRILNLFIKNKPGLKKGNITEVIDILTLLEDKLLKIITREKSKIYNPKLIPDRK